MFRLGLGFRVTVSDHVRSSSHPRFVTGRGSGFVVNGRWLGRWVGGTFSDSLLMLYYSERCANNDSSVWTGQC